LLLQKAAEEWHQHIVAVKGNASDVEQAIHGLEIIYQHMFMQELTAVIYSNGRHIEGQNIKLERVSLQDMLVYLSKQQKARAIK